MDLVIEETVKRKISKLYEQLKGSRPEMIQPLRASGSYRRYFRISGSGEPVIGAWYDQVAENRAFINFTKHFRKHGLPVPEILAVSDDLKYYLLEDLGDKVLLDHVLDIRNKPDRQHLLVELYRDVLDHLIRFQVVAGKTLDYSVCFPAGHFDEQAYMWDLNYFKYNFLKLINIPFDEYRLEKDFETLVAQLLSADHSWFVYRDFQARNIMLHNGSLYFIDYQGGRRGSLHYDVASLLFQAKAALPFQVREALLDHYVGQVEKVAPAAAIGFRNHYYKFVLIRVLQTLGAYGLRGIHEQKPHFIQSIPFALENVKWLLDHGKVDDDLPELKACLQLSLKSIFLEKMVSPTLTLHVNSFSYKRGIPVDLSGNGGGFVFDCRALPNPGRYAEYAAMTGLDAPVQHYLEKYAEVERFVENARNMVEHAVGVYTRRGFTSLMVSFGCTGGQHRSVYCAEKLAGSLSDAAGIRVVLRHREQE